MKLKGYGTGQCVIKCALNHDAIESLPLSDKRHKQTDHGRVVDITCIPTTSCDEKFLRPQCRNCSRDPDHAHLGNTHSSQDEDFAWPTRAQKLKSLALAVVEIFHWV